MYIEYKGEDITGPGRIGRVTFSKSGLSLYYGSKCFKSLKGHGSKSNYYDAETREEYWISGCRKDGNDALYSAIIEVDEDVRAEYWRDIRSQPENVALSSFRSPGKY